MKTLSGRLLLVLGMAIGTSLVVLGLQFPIYSDPFLAEQIFIEACDHNGVVSGWYERAASIRTLRYPLIDGGISLLLGAVTTGGIFWAFGSGRGVRLNTPSRPMIFFALGTLIVFVSWFSQMLSLMTDQERKLFPWCADTVIIPMMSLTGFYIALQLVAMLVGAILVRYFAPLPVPLWQWQPQESARSWVWTVVFGALGLVVFFLAVDGAATSAFLGTPAAILALYLIEATRSALVAGSDGLESDE